MSKAPTGDECEALFEILRTAWESGDLEPLRGRVVTRVGNLQTLEPILGRPVSMEGAEPIADRKSLLGVRTSLGGVMGIEVIRDREGLARLELGAFQGNPKDPKSTFAGLVEGARRMESLSASSRGRSPTQGKKRPKSKWRPAPEAFPSIDQLPYLGIDRPKVSADAFASLEAAIGAPLPEGYVAYVTRFGESCDSTFLRVYPPDRVLRERDEWRRRIDTYWFWSTSEDGFDQDAAYESYVLADTLSGDEIVWHPKRPSAFYVLPRNGDEVIAREMSFEAALAWASSSGDLDGRVAFRVVAPLRERVRVELDYGDEIDVDAILGALTAIGDGVQSHRSEEDEVVIWPAHGLEVFVSEEPYLGMSHEPKTDAAFVRRVVDALASCGHPLVG